MKRAIVVMTVGLALAAQAQLVSFLVASWHDRKTGNQMCRYDNGTVLNVGINLCPLSIPA